MKDHLFLYLVIGSLAVMAYPAYFFRPIIPGLRDTYTNESCLRGRRDLWTKSREDYIYHSRDYSSFHQLRGGVDEENTE